MKSIYEYFNSKHQDLFNVCPLCSHPSTPWRIIREVELYKCTECKHIHQNTNTIKCDEQDYITDIYHYNTTYKENIAQDIKTSRKRLDYINKMYSECQTLIDVGCSIGTFLKTAKEYNYKITDGIEPNTESVKYAREEFDLPLMNTTLNKDFELDRKYEVVYSSDVIEHVKSPILFIKKLKELMDKHNSIMVLFTPDYDSIVHNYQVKLNEHLHYFTKKTLTTFLETQGLEVLEVKTVGRFRDIYHLEGNSTFKRPSIIQMALLSIMLTCNIQPYYFLKDNIMIIARMRK
jgi:2-polyprenyl-3-methyl-5-hydroxy-6-metoxy-1,4-benzoquinol methylase